MLFRSDFPNIREASAVAYCTEHSTNSTNMPPTATGEYCTGAPVGVAICLATTKAKLARIRILASSRKSAIDCTINAEVLIVIKYHMLDWPNSV